MLPELAACKNFGTIAKPTGFHVAAHTATEIDLAWTNGDATAKVDIYCNGSFLIQKTAGSTSHAHTGLSGGTANTYQIRHSKSDGTYSVRTAVLIGFTSLPAPLSLTNSVSGQDVTLNWTNTDPAVAVRIYRAGSLIDTVVAGVSTYLDAGLSDATYAYKVTHYDSSGPSESGFSNTSSAVVDAVPNDPSALAATPVSGTENDLSWTANDTNGTDTCEIYRDTSSNPTTLLSTVAATAAAFVDTTAVAGTTYHYRVRNKRGSLFSSYSSDVTCVTLGAGPSGPPTGLSLSTPNTDRVTVSWTNGDSSAATQIYRGGSLLHTSSAGDTTYNDDTVAQGTSYTYKLRHSKNSQFSAYTSDNSTTTPNPSITSATIIGNVGDDHFVMTWAPGNSPRSATYQMFAWTDADGESNSTPATITSPHTESSIGFTIEAKNPGVTHAVTITVTFKILDSTSTVVLTDTTTFVLPVYKTT